MMMHHGISTDGLVPSAQLRLQPLTESCLRRDPTFLPLPAKLYSLFERCVAGLCRNHSLVLPRNFIPLLDYVTRNLCFLLPLLKLKQDILHILCDEVNVFRVDRCLRWNEKVQNLRIRIIVIRCSEKNRSFAFLFIEFLRVFIYIYILRENIQSTFFQHQRYVEATSRIVKRRGRVACSSGEQNRSRNHESERRSPSNR